jgi:hypothetical protein
MIDLHYTKEHMLAEIKASEKACANCLHNPAAPDFVVLDEACLRVQGQTPDELLPALSATFSARCADVPPRQLRRDLLAPLKKGLGNAYKWGNHKDPAKRITVETVATKTGLLVAISDEGAGFDVPRVVGQFRRGERHFTHGGSGFRHFDRAKSLCSYTNNGRTLLLRFLYMPEPGQALTVAATLAAGRPAKRNA